MTNLRIRTRPPPIAEVCPDCKGRMTVTEVRPLLLLDGVESITYKCEKCRVEESWILQSASSKPADCFSHPGRYNTSELASATCGVEHVVSANASPRSSAFAR